MVDILQISSDATSSMKTFAIQMKYHWNVFLRFNWYWFSIDLSNGLVPNRCQTIAWSNVYQYCYSDVIMSTMVSQITGISIVCWTACSGTDQRNHQSLLLLALCEGNPPVTGGFPSQRASITENVFIWSSCISMYHQASMLCNCVFYTNVMEVTRISMKPFLLKMWQYLGISCLPFWMMLSDKQKLI